MWSEIVLCATCLFLPHFDVFFDLLLKRCKATWNLLVNFWMLSTLPLSLLTEFYAWIGIVYHLLCTYMCSLYKSDQLETSALYYLGFYRAWKTWKVLEFYWGLFQDWKVLEKNFFVLESSGNLLTSSNKKKCMVKIKANWHWDLGSKRVNVNFRVLEKLI